MEQAVHERKIAKEAEQKIKEEKENSEAEIKQIKKSTLAIENKIEQLKIDREQIKVEREDY